MNEPVNQRPQEDSLLIMTAVLAGSLIATSQQEYAGFLALLSVYAYWIVRVVAEAMMFVSVRYAVGKYFPDVTSTYSVTALATAISLIPFVLVVLAVDIVLGMLSVLISPDSSEATQWTDFGTEIINITANHMLLCTLLSLPRLLMSRQRVSDDPPETAVSGIAADSSGTILSSIEPPLSGPILWAEAQEECVKLVTSSEDRVVFNRFSDILRELPADEGVRVNRSHWVAFSAVSELFKDGQNLMLRLKTDEVFPVSRSYRMIAEVALSKAVLDQSTR